MTVLDRCGLIATPAYFNAAVSDPCVIHVPPSTDEGLEAVHAITDEVEPPGLERDDTTH
jgi:hypothetical protein